MKAQALVRTGSVITWIIAFSVLFLVSTQANAHRLSGPYAPVAMCTTAIPNVNMPIQPYVCCQLLDKNGHHVWRDTWVFGSCKNADPYATRDMGCKTDSSVYGTNMPILGSCQFSDSTGKYL